MSFCKECQKPTVGKRMYCSDYCRKQFNYSSTCVDCGGRVKYGGKPQPDRCSGCSRKMVHERAHRNYMEAFRDWYERYGEIPNAYDWIFPAPSAVERISPERIKELERRHAHRKWPYPSGIVEFYGSWNKAIEAAGFTPLEKGARRDPVRHRRSLRAGWSRRINDPSRYTARQLAEKWQVSPGTIRLWARAGKIPHNRVGQMFVFDKGEIETLERNGGFSN